MTKILIIIGVGLAAILSVVCIILITNEIKSKKKAKENVQMAIRIAEAGMDAKSRLAMVPEKSENIIADTKDEPVPSENIQETSEEPAEVILGTSEEILEEEEETDDESIEETVVSSELNISDDDKPDVTYEDSLAKESAEEPAETFEENSEILEDESAIEAGEPEITENIAESIPVEETEDFKEDIPEEISEDAVICSEKPEVKEDVKPAESEKPKPKQNNSNNHPNNSGNNQHRKKKHKHKHNSSNSNRPQGNPQQPLQPNQIENNSKEETPEKPVEELKIAEEQLPEVKTEEPVSEKNEAAVKFEEQVKPGTPENEELKSSENEDFKAEEIETKTIKKEEPAKASEKKKSFMDIFKKESKPEAEKAVNIPYEVVEDTVRQEEPEVINEPVNTEPEPASEDEGEKVNHKTWVKKQTFTNIDKNDNSVHGLVSKMIPTTVVNNTQYYKIEVAYFNKETVSIVYAVCDPGKESKNLKVGDCVKLLKYRNLYKFIEKESKSVLSTFERMQLDNVVG